MQTPAFPPPFPASPPARPNSPHAAPAHASPPAASSIVCHCFQIAERQILAAISLGAATVPDLFAAVRAEGGCRGCTPQLERMLRGLPPSAFHCGRCGGSSLLCGCGG